MSKLILLLPAALLLFGNCGTSPVTAGGGASETVATVTPYENGVRVSVSGDDAFAVAAKIYNSKFSRFDTGWFRDSATLSNNRIEWLLPVLPESTLHIFVIDSSGGTAAFFLYDNSSGGSPGQQEKKLTLTGTVSGGVSILTKAGIREPAAGYWVIIPGSPFNAETGSDGSYNLSGIPEGSYSIEARNDMKINIRNGIPISIEISSRENSLIRDIIIEQ